MIIVSVNCESPRKGSNILDLILIPSPDYVQNVQVSEPFQSDHNYNYL
jgi:hypothetical protein